MQPVSERKMNFIIHNLFNQIYAFWFYSGVFDSYAGILSNEIYFNPFSIFFL